MENRNSYYSIACSDFNYLKDVMSTGYCNQLAEQAQRVAEKMLKSVAEVTCVDIEKLLKSHNIRGIYDMIHRVEPDFVLDRNGLSTLKDYYYDTQYPGENFIIVTEEELLEAYEIMLSVVGAVERWREAHGLPVELASAREEFRLALKQQEEKMKSPDVMNVF
ncbi:HEPN domain-containing protein [Lachnospiraceae bacterium 47-T17]